MDSSIGRKCLENKTRWFYSTRLYYLFRLPLPLFKDYHLKLITTNTVNTMTGAHLFAYSPLRRPICSTWCQRDFKDFFIFTTGGCYPIWYQLHKNCLFKSSWYSSQDADEALGREDWDLTLFSPASNLREENSAELKNLHLFCDIWIRMGSHVCL